MNQALPLAPARPPDARGWPTAEDVARLRAANAASAGDVTRKLNRETVLLLGWGPAVLMQLAHPLVAAGVGGHSAFLPRPDLRLHRLNQTVQAMLALTFGSAAEVARAARAINALHDRVKGDLAEAAGPFPAGTTYSANDPALLCWVYATLLDTLPRAYQRYVGPLTAEELDRHCAEASLIAPLLGVPDGVLPASRAGLERYLAGMYASGALTVTPLARAIAREIVWPSAPRRLRPLRPLLYLPTVGLLPPAIRDAYGLRWTPRHERALRRTSGLVRRLLPCLPAAWHRWPAARNATPAAI